MRRSKKSETKKEITAEEMADFKKTLMDVAAALMPDMVDESFDSFVAEVHPTDKVDPYDQILTVVSTYSEKNKFHNMINDELRRRALERRRGEKK